jgi:hypothetical protein
LANSSNCSDWQRHKTTHKTRQHDKRIKIFRCFDLSLNQAGHDELLDLVKEAAEKAEGFDGKIAEAVDDSSLGQSDVRAVGAQSRKTYMRELHKVYST